MLLTLRSQLTIRHALSLSAILAATVAASFILLRAEANLDLNVTPADVTVSGDDSGDTSGEDVATGDINGDTIEDLIIGAPEADPPGGSRAGETYVIYGEGSLPATIDLDSVSADVTVRGGFADDRAGLVIATGDIDGDTTDDLIIGAPHADPPGGSRAGRTYVIYGSGALASTIELQDGIAGIIIAGDDTNDFSGVAVAAGDINGDTADDVIVGAASADPGGRSEAGETYVVFGGPQATPKPTPTATPTVTNTATPTATPTPKIGSDGSLSGVFDVQIHPNDKNLFLYHCIARMDHETAGRTR